MYYEAAVVGTFTTSNLVESEGTNVRYFSWNWKELEHIIGFLKACWIVAS